MIFPHPNEQLFSGENRKKSAKTGKIIDNRVIKYVKLHHVSSV